MLTEWKPARGIAARQKAVLEDSLANAEPMPATDPQDAPADANQPGSE